MAINVRAIKKNHSYSALAPIAEILADLEMLAVMDKEAEQQLKQYGKLKSWFAIGAVICVFLLALPYPYSFLALSVLVSFLIALVWASIKQSKYVGLDLPDERYQFAQEIAQILARDMTPEQPIQLDVGFRDTLAKANKVSSQPYVKRRGWKLDIHQNGWFKVQGGFADGCRFSLALQEIAHYVYGYKRSASGKRKHKSKTKWKGMTLDLQIICPRKRYGALDLLRNDAEKAVKMLPGVQLKRCRASAKGLVITLKLPPEFSATEIRDSITTLLLSAYQVLNLAQQLSQKSKPPKKSKKRKRNGGRIGA